MGCRWRRPCWHWRLRSWWALPYSQFLGKDPVRGLVDVFNRAGGKSLYGISEVLVKATPLVLIALGLSVCFRSNIWNIGAEGQLVMRHVFGSGREAM